MKFSLTQLLAVTLLACLAIKGANDIRIAEAKRLECESLEAEISSGEPALEFFDEKKLIYTRAFSSFEKRKAGLLAASDIHEPAAVMFREPDAKQSDKIYVANYSNEFSRQKHSMHTNQCFRIWVPESQQFELCLGFHEPRSDFSQERELLTSYHFHPNSMLSTPLDSGGSLVEFHLAKKGGRDLVRVVVDGKTVHYAFRETIDGDFAQSLDLSNANEDAALIDGKKPPPLIVAAAGELTAHAPKRLTLLTANHWLTEDNLESVSLVIRPVEEGPNRER